MINMKEGWKDLGFKDKAQYVTALVLVISGILIAFINFFITYNINEGVLIYIAQAFTAAGSIFGVSIYFKSKMGQFSTEVQDMINKAVKNYEKN